MPRPWEAGVQVTPVSVANLFNGNVITVIPLVGCDPIGPPIEFTLYHNSASALNGESGFLGNGLDLGPGWSTSYSGRVASAADPNDPPVPNDPNHSVLVIEDDGTKNVFTYSSGYSGPAGVHDWLRFQSGSPGKWILTRPDQTKRVFGEDGLLEKVVDPFGHEVTLDRDPNNAIQKIHSAASDPNHFIEILGDGPNLMVSGVYDDKTFCFGADPGGTRLGCINKLPGSKGCRTPYCHFTYLGTDDPNTTADDPNSRLAEVGLRPGAECDCRVWEFSYSSGHLSNVIDPRSNRIQYHQELAPLSEPSAGFWERIFTDRRGRDWTFLFDDDGRLLEVTDPLRQQVELGYDADNNIDEFIDALENAWTATYGDVGNLETLSSPIQNQTWTLSWEQPDPNIPNFLRLIEVEDPNANWVQLDYEDPNHPTLVTLITEQADGYGNAAAETVLEYYVGGGDPNDWRGLLKSVTDANGVQTLFTYDDWGYLASMEEGLFDGTDAAVNTVSYSQTNDANGRPTDGSSDSGGFDLGYHAQEDWIRAASCAIAEGGVLPPRLGASVAAHLGVRASCWIGTELNAIGQPHFSDYCSDPWQELLNLNRSHEVTYDTPGLGHVAQLDRKTFETSRNPVHRVFDFPIDYHEPAGPQRVELPDGQWVFITYDELGRPWCVQRAASADPNDPNVPACNTDPNNLSMLYRYDAAGRLE